MTIIGTLSITSPFLMRRRAKTPRPFPLIRFTAIESECVNAIRSSPACPIASTLREPAALLTPEAVPVNENNGAVSRARPASARHWPRKPPMNPSQFTHSTSNSDMKTISREIKSRLDLKSGNR